MVMAMWKSGALALLTLVVMGCATPEQLQKRLVTDEAADQKRIVTDEAADQKRLAADEAANQKRLTADQRRLAADQKRLAAEQKRLAAHMQRDLAPVCTSAGFTPGTDAHSHCIDSLYRQELKRAATAASPQPR
jgi:hypothetical protein